MLFDDVHLLGLGVELGELVSPEEAVNTGERGRRNAIEAGQRSISVSELSGPELALAAGRAALHTAAAWLDADVTHVPIDLHLHATIWDKGIDFWSAACFARPSSTAAPGLSVELGGMSNSVVAGIELAGRTLGGPSDFQVALLTAGDRFGAPGFCAWNTDAGIIYGDAGCGVVLARRPGLARVVAACSWTDAGLEGLNRGHEPHRRQPDADRVSPLDVGGRKVDWSRATGISVAARNAVGVSEVVKRVLDEACADLGDIAMVCTPFYGGSLARKHLLAPLGVSGGQTSAALGSRLGHLGASDQIVALWHQLHTGRLRPGDLVLLLGIGVGMTWTAALLRVTALPAEQDPIPEPLRELAA
jgi:3-oxoacyl-[acyl-carrier-protein] synthase-3